MSFKHVVLWILLVDTVCWVTGAGSFTFPISGVFNKETKDTSLQAYLNIVKRRNAYDGDPIRLNVTDSYSTALEVCSSTGENNGVMAIIDPRPTRGICDTTCLLCNRLNISHLSTGWQLPDTLPDDLYTFSYHPPYELTSKAYAALIRHLQWDKFSIMYESDESFLRVQEIINSWPHDADRIMYAKLDPDGDNRETFKNILKVNRFSYHVIDCELQNIPTYIKQIVQVDNSTEYQRFILTDLDAHTLSFEDIPELMANVSTLHLATTNNERWKDFNMDSSNIKLETALTADALDHLEMAIRAMQESPGWKHKLISQPFIKNPPGLCFSDTMADYQEKAWYLGNDLREALLNTTIEGFTGHVQFDEEGKRTNFRLQLAQLNVESQFVHAGHWDSTTDVITQDNVVVERSGANTNTNDIRVATRLGLPYYNERPENGTIVKEGFAVSLIDKIFKHMSEKQNYKRTYRFERVAGDKYGNPIEGTRKWDGLVGALMEHNAELAVCDLTITAERNAVIEFSTPFMDLGISMLAREPDPVDPNLFAFLEPLAMDVWLYLATGYLIVSFVLLLSARMSQGDWVNPHPCNENPENLQNIWTLYNCMWLTMGSIMTQGCDILPRAAGSRWVTGVWWFFAMIITASYTANMSTFLSNSRRSNDVKNVQDLVKQTKVSYGAMTNASTYKFFQKSNDSTYAKIWETMITAKPTVFTQNNEEGVERVNSSKGNYIFFMESTSIDYYVKRACNLKMLGGKLDSKEYGVAMPKNSPLKNYIDIAILSLQESGELETLKKEWWEKNAETNCPKTNTDAGESGLKMQDVGGIFLVLGAGGVLGLIVAVIDFLIHANEIAVKEKVTYREALKSEWRTSLNPRALHKPAAPARSVAASSSSRSGSPGEPRSRAVSVLKAATSLINFDDIY